MTGILQSLSDLISSILNAILSAFESVFALFGTAVGDVASLGKGIIDLILGNIVIIGVALAALVGFSAYQQRRGKEVGGSTMGKKLK